MEYLICFTLIFIAALLLAACGFLVLIFQQLKLLQGSANQLLMQRAMEANANAAGIFQGKVF